MQVGLIRHARSQDLSCHVLYFYFLCTMRLQSTDRQTDRRTARSMSCVYYIHVQQLYGECIQCVG